VTASGWARYPTRLGWRAAIRDAVLVLVVVAIATVALPMGNAVFLPPGAQACGKAVGPFTVHGTKVLAGNGSVFVPYGMTVSGLQEGNWTNLVGLDLEKIAAIADDWCANTVRIQTNEDMLLGLNGKGFNSGYMAAIKSEVALAESYKLVVVLNDETNFTFPLSVRHHQADPTRETEIFWKDMTRVYGNDPQVIFDLYNEPRTSVPTMGQARLWHLWLDGGEFKGVRYKFGMAALAKYVRYTAGARNLFWIEGPRYSLSFAGMIRHHALIHVSDVVYAIHHAQGAHDEAAWYAAFGYLVVDGIAPVVNGEFTNYEPHPNPAVDLDPGYCWANAPTAVPKYFQYLTSLGIGMVAYQLVPGWLISSDRYLGDPTKMNPRTWSCVPDDERQPGQSAGAMIMSYFERRNG
jgi:Cellulase (glycosyl hydrolase family 5)